MRRAAAVVLSWALGACGTSSLVYSGMPDTGGAGGGTGGGGGVVYPTVSFSRRVQPIFAARCFACHIARHDGGLDLSLGHSYQNLVNVPSTCNSSINRVTPGDVRLSMLVSSLTTSPYDCVRAMPLGGNGLLSENPFDYQTIRLWVEQGAPDN
ncbi:MAG: hypothetical protein QM765_01200 [Myxococcales bacterium]